MKKLFASLLACAMLAVSFAGCASSFDPLSNENRTSSTATTSTEATSEGATQAETEPATEIDKDYKDSYESLEEYMMDKGLIEYDDKKNKRVEMEANLIGAKTGYRYTKGDVKIELYEFDLNNLNDIAKNCIDSIKKNGYYTIYEKNIDATLSENGKYMMIYYNPAMNGEDNSQAVEKYNDAVETFKAFAPVA